VTVLGEGSPLVTVERRIDQDHVGRYADAVGDQNPIHIDPSYAATTPFGGTIVHGMFVLALVSESLTATFGERWGTASRLKVRFRAPARPGELLRAGGRVVRIADEDGRRYAECAVECRNEGQELLIGGEVRVPVDDGGGTDS
jgi:3-hydroxybutyryl-CoA dehydratase